MSPKIPSIWIEVKETSKQSVLVADFYREWNHKGDKSQTSQVECMVEFSNQIERAAEEGKQCVVMGDANLCFQKW